MIKYLVMDVDGSLTDGKVYMGQNGEVMKAFSIKDGYAINYILKPANIIPIVITARSSNIVKNRCEELGINKVYQGKIDKLSTLVEIIGNFSMGECAYFGDDLIDLKCMIPIKNAGGIVGCPADAVQEIKAISDYICINKAGEGALREFSEWIVNCTEKKNDINNRVQNSVAYLRTIKVTEDDVNKKIVVNNDFFYYVQSYNTKKEFECRLESHRKYVDIQILVLGEEMMDIVDISRLRVKEKYDKIRDVMFWENPTHMARFSLKAGDVIVLFPENAHRCAIANNSVNNVLKIVGKLRI